MLRQVSWGYNHARIYSYVLDDGDHLPMRKLLHIMLNYSTFLRRAKGDLESCEKILRKALEVLFITTDIY